MYEKCFISKVWFDSQVLVRSFGKHGALVRTGGTQFSFFQYKSQTSPKMSSHSFLKLSVKVHSSGEGLVCAPFVSEAQKPIPYCPLWKRISSMWLLSFDSSSCDRSFWQAVWNLSPPQTPGVGRRPVLKQWTNEGLQSRKPEASSCLLIRF